VSVGILAVTCAASCGRAHAPVSPDDVLVNDLAFCVSETNRYRAMAGVPALATMPDLQTYAMAAAQADAETKVPHSYFSDHEPEAPAAENEEQFVLGSIGHSAHDLISQALATFFAQGPGGDHYDNLVGPYTQIGCGTYAAGSLYVVVQDFR
jgi:hypothetical protein